MEDEVEDIVGNVKYTNSQKSVTTSNVYSLDFTDSTSEKNSGQETYVIDCDNSDVSEKTFGIQDTQSTVSLKEEYTTSIVLNEQTRAVQSEPFHGIDRSIGSSQHRSIMAHEIFTQTSKTIIELAQYDGTDCNKYNTLETQTSLFSITENRTLEYRVKLIDSNSNAAIINTVEHVQDKDYNIQVLTDSLEDKSSFCRESDNDVQTNGNKASGDLDAEMIRFIDDVNNSDDYLSDQNLTKYENSDFESKQDSDMEEDSLMEATNEYHVGNESHEITSDTSEIPKSIERDIEELYHRITDNVNQFSVQHTSIDQDPQNICILTPLTEETTHMSSSLVDLTPTVRTMAPSIKKHGNNTEEKYCKTKVRPFRVKNESADLKLPAINKNASCPNSLLNFLFTLNIPKELCKTNTLPILLEGQKNAMFHRCDDDSKDPASGESPYISGEIDSPHAQKVPVQLPPIHAGDLSSKRICSRKIYKADDDTRSESISIRKKIRELKGSPTVLSQRRAKVESRSPSPTSIYSPDRSELCDAAEKGCEALCSELLRRLRLPMWCEVMETLNEIPQVMEKFWPVISETRTADLIRQVSVHVESPRTQLARSACGALADILKNTNYTKKPDFYEAIAILLIKTGSYSRPVRRAANMALDDIVCSVDPTPSLTAICICGTGHKSGLVRSASARLLVVCCAVAEGGRLLLRGRPQTAVMARKKYAERLYAMLRPLPNFEAYFLTDVDVEVATKQMRKYDQILADQNMIKMIAEEKKRDQEKILQRKREQHLAKFRSREQDLGIQRNLSQNQSRQKCREQDSFKQKVRR
ncbi:uncharacterized protein LOC126974527 isoform X3 [Leptidea sinapis]|uniref:uncharacterized protein LOC126974527 isoform X3 n=1 Tax=Leptidea sinapis TaxID=189913 RepID=UPI0021C2627B|nr:uncharacterized protein LOC126974527 isoform X3 [Leptidea sinapis]